MYLNYKTKHKDISLSVSILIALGVTLLLMLISGMALAYLILLNYMQENGIGLPAKIVLIISVLIGAKIIIAQQQNNKYIGLGIYTVMLFVFSIIIGLALGIDLKLTVLNAVFIVCGAAIGLLPIKKKNKKQTYSKRRYG